MLARIGTAQAGLERLQRALGYARGSLQRSDVPGIDGAIFMAVAEVELRHAREMATEVMAAVDLATATPEPRS